MANAQSICHAPPGAHTAAPRLSSALLGLNKEWRRRARSRRELAALCDRSLRDIGATRYDVYSEMHKPFWRA